MAAGFPGLNLTQRTIQAPKNPLDRCTIVSIYPRDINEVKETTQPRVYKIPAGSVDNPSILVVGSASWWRKIDEDQPLLEIPNGAIQCADGFVKDFCNGLLGCDMKQSMPGLFWVVGEHAAKDIKTKFPTEFTIAKNKQHNYWQALLKMADGLWARTNGSPLSISDDMRLAAKELGIENKDWMQSFLSLEMIRCIACGSLRNPSFPVCGNCKTVVDEALYNKSFAKTTEAPAK